MFSTGEKISQDFQQITKMAERGHPSKKILINIKVWKSRIKFTNRLQSLQNINLSLRIKFKFLIIAFKTYFLSSLHTQNQSIYIL